MTPTTTPTAIDELREKLMALLPPAPDAGEVVEECKMLLRVMIERDPHETITDPDAGQWQMIDEWRHRARKALAALGEGGAHV